MLVHLHIVILDQVKWKGLLFSLVSTWTTPWIAVLWLFECPATQQVSVWAQAWLLGVHKVGAYLSVRKGAPCGMVWLLPGSLTWWVRWGWISDLLAQVHKVPGPKGFQWLERSWNESCSGEMFWAISSLSICMWEQEFLKANNASLASVSLMPPQPACVLHEPRAPQRSAPTEPGCRPPWLNSTEEGASPRVAPSLKLPETSDGVYGILLAWLSLVTTAKKNNRKG